MPRTTKPATKPRTATAPPSDLDPRLRVRFFPTTATVTDEIAAWAAEHGHRVRAVVPIYWEDVRHE